MVVVMDKLHLPETKSLIKILSPDKGLFYLHKAQRKLWPVTI